MCIVQQNSIGNTFTLHTIRTHNNLKHYELGPKNAGSFQADSGWNCCSILTLLGSGHQKPAWNLPVPNVQYRTPDDGQRRCPKHVEFYDRINLVYQCVWLVINKKFITKQHGNMNEKYKNTAILDKATCLFTALQAGRSRFRFPMFSLEFPIDVILQAALWPWGRINL
jgi:hypothetical protein